MDSGHKASVGIVGAGLGGTFPAALVEKRFDVRLYNKRGGREESGYGVHVAESALDTVGVASCLM